MGEFATPFLTITRADRPVTYPSYHLIDHRLFGRASSIAELPFVDKPDWMLFWSLPVHSPATQ